MRTLHRTQRIRTPEVGLTWLAPFVALLCVSLLVLIC